MGVEPMQLSDRIGRRIKLQDLHTLMAVVQAGSMGKAARILNTSQPNISKSVADLEHVLGVSLLERHRHGVAPTAYGRALLDCGVTVFDELRQGVKNLEFLADPQAGEVRIGSGHNLMAGFVSAVVDRLSRRYPRMVFHLVTSDRFELLQRELHERKVDLLIGRKLNSIEGQEFNLLFEDSYFVVADASHPWSRRRRIEPAELAEASWVLMPPDTPPGALAMEAFRTGGLDYRRATVFAAPPDVRMSLLATGRFLTIFSASALRFPRGRPKLRILPVELRLAHVQIGISFLRKRTLSPAVRLFIEAAREVAKPLANRK
jgi:DNA-binding transcriptional LysR family regulator